MTVSRSIVEWLKGYDMTAVKVDTDQVGEGADSLGLFKSPNRETTAYNDGSYQIVEYYQLFVVRDGQENFAYWVDDARYQGNLPQLDRDRQCTDLELAGTPYMFEARENNTALYQVSLKITYVRERGGDEW